MTKLRYYLTGILFLQILLAVIIFGVDSQDDIKPDPLFSFAVNAIDRVKFSDQEATVELVKKGDAWQLPALDSLPVDEAKLQAIIKKVENFKPDWPETTTPASHKRFEVAEDNFQRRVQFYQGEQQLGELYLGTSPGFRKSHIRKASDDAVYNMALTSYELPVKAIDWLDKKLLSVADVTGVSTGGFTMVKKEQVWQLAEDVDSNQALDQDKSNQVALAFNGLLIQNIAGDKIEFKSDKSVEISNPSGKWTYEIMKQDDKFYLTRNDRKEIFEISQFDYDRISKIGLPSVVKTDASAEEKKESVTEAPKS